MGIFLTYYKNTFRQGVPNDGGSHVVTSSIRAVPLGVAEMCTWGSQAQPLFYTKHIFTPFDRYTNVHVGHMIC